MEKMNEQMRFEFMFNSLSILLSGYDKHFSVEKYTFNDLLGKRLFLRVVGSVNPYWFRLLSENYCLEYLPDKGGLFIVSLRNVSKFYEIFSYGTSTLNK